MSQSSPPLWLLRSVNHLGTKEKPGPESNPEITGFFIDVDQPERVSDETPWCAAFVGAMLERSGQTSTKSLLARSYLDWGKPIKTPAIGAIAVFSRGSDPNAGHIGFVVGETASSLYIIGGNQANAVTVQTFEKKRLLGLRWPEGKENTKQSQTTNNTPLITTPLFQTALAKTLAFESGWSNHPEDPGGPTNKGITLKTYQSAIDQRLINRPERPLIEALQNITDDDIALIYHKLYWQRANCQLLPTALAVMHFDAAVNHGPVRAIKFLQQAAGATTDGEWGPETAAKVMAGNEPALFNRYHSIREAFYRALNHFPTFGRGWMNRLRAITEFANQFLPEDQSSKQQNKYHQQKEHDPMTSTNTETKKWWAESLTIWGTIVTALATILPLIGPFIGIDITGEMVEELGESVARLIQILAGTTGTGMALYGRVRATAPLTRRAVAMKL